MLDDFCAENPNTWDQEVNRFLFQFRTIAPYTGGVSPFNLMFARNPTGTEFGDLEGGDILCEVFRVFLLIVLSWIVV